MSNAIPDDVKLKRGRGRPRKEIEDTAGSCAIVFLRGLIKNSGMSLVVLADLADVSQTSLSAILTGRLKISDKWAKVLSHLFGISPVAFLVMQALPVDPEAMAARQQMYVEMKKEQKRLKRVKKLKCRGAMLTKTKPPKKKVKVRKKYTRRVLDKAA